MQTLITSGVEVKVETFYQASYSKPILNEFMHSYRIRLYNHNSFAVQLLRRVYIITDATSDIKAVEGEGLVGDQPILYPGDTYSYVSGCNLGTAIGKMEGLYIFDNKV